MLFGHTHKRSTLVLFGLLMFAVGSCVGDSRATHRAEKQEDRITAALIAQSMAIAAVQPPTKIYNVDVNVSAVSITDGISNTSISNVIVPDTITLKEEPVLDDLDFQFNDDFLRADNMMQWSADAHQSLLDEFNERDDTRSLVRVTNPHQVTDPAQLTSGTIVYWYHCTELLGEYTVIGEIYTKTLVEGFDMPSLFVDLIDNETGIIYPTSLVEMGVIASPSNRWEQVNRLFNKIN